MPCQVKLERGPALLAAHALTALFLGLSGAAPVWAAGDVQHGAQLARQCMACHSFAPGHHMTGPSLGGLWGRRAGTAMGFGRYSEALKGSTVIWGPATLDAWLRNPGALIPGNAMLFRGMPDAAARADLVAFLQAASEGRVKVPDQAPPDLKQAPSSDTVSAIRYCGDAYRVVMGDGKTRTWWEFNLRFKTDGSKNGPAAGKPVIVGNGMQGDRASVVFSRPEEISAFVRRHCP
jgi:cytochrome c